MKRISAATLMILMVFTLLSASVFAAAPDFGSLGFPKVAAEKVIDPAKADSMAYGDVKIDVPAGAFKNKVMFQVLEGPLADFQKNTPKGETVLMDFAFRVKDMNTNELVGKFEKPLLFSFTNDKVNEKSKYYNTLTNGTFSLNAMPAKIEGTKLSHPVAGAGVGWAVTSPETPVKNATSPVTGLNVIPWVSAGIFILLAGLVLSFLAKRSKN